jgi:phosphate transport system substrate-binding protein
VNKDNPINGLTSQEVQDIFTGKETKWSDFTSN